MTGWALHECSNRSSLHLADGDQSALHRKSCPFPNLPMFQPDFFI